MTINFLRFEEKYYSELNTYAGMSRKVKCFEQDLPYFEDPENVDRKDDLAKAVSTFTVVFIIQLIF
jgi:hypothetical protein